MRTGYASVLVCLVSSALLVMTGCGGDSPSGSPVATETTPPTIPHGYSSKSIHVKFQEGTNVERPLEGLTPGLRDAVVSHRKLFSLPEEKLNELRAKERSRVGTPLPDLNLWVEMTLRSGTDAAAFLAEMKQVLNVEIASSAPLPQPPPWIPPDFTRKQGYLDPAPGGIEARFSWTIPGGNGQGVTIYDIEYNWLQTHDDLSSAGAVILLLNPGDSNNPPGFKEMGCPAPCDGINREHGTAVLGAICARRTKGAEQLPFAREAHRGVIPLQFVGRQIETGREPVVELARRQFRCDRVRVTHPTPPASHHAQTALVEQPRRFIRATQRADALAGARVEGVWSHAIG